MRLMDSRITQLKAEGPSRTCNESKEEEEHLLVVEVQPDFAVFYINHMVIDSGHTRETSLGGVPREQKMLQGHLPRVIYQQVYQYTKTN